MPMRIALVLIALQATFSAWPAEVASFLERRELCDHLRGEDLREDSRIETLNQSCAGTDRELARLKRKYAADSTILARLNSFELNIEIDPCVSALPAALSARLETAYPSGKVVTFDQLHPTDQDLYDNDHPAQCPGLVRLDFYGRSTKQLALLLFDGKQTLLLLADDRGKDRWNIRQIDLVDSHAAPVIIVLPADRKKELRARHDVLALVWYESASVAYIWSRNRVEKIWLSD